MHEYYEDRGEKRKVVFVCHQLKKEKPAINLLKIRTSGDLTSVVTILETNQIVCEKFKERWGQPFSLADECQELGIEYQKMGHTKGIAGNDANATLR